MFFGLFLCVLNNIIFYYRPRLPSKLCGGDFSPSFCLPQVSFLFIFTAFPFSPADRSAEFIIVKGFPSISNDSFDLIWPKVVIDSTEISSFNIKH